LNITARPAGLRILVVDDVRDNADSCAMLLQMDGHEVRAAYSGREALEIAPKFRPQMMLLDIVMPEMTGYELARTVRAAAWGKKIMLVAVTGWGQVEDRRKAMDAGFDHHFAKPISMDDLKPLIAQCRARADS
jgi:CheY-like chemotaxis protein